MVSKLTKKNIKRIDNRNSSELRDVKITPNYLPDSEGSALIEVGNTKVICSATIEKKVPRWLKGKGSGWVTAEYSMLPRSSKDRIQRERFKVSGRTQEIQRLIGRSLRSIVDLEMLGEVSIIIDCDVIRADGGTKTASITGAFTALNLAIIRGIDEKLFTANPIKNLVSAVSIGIVEKNILLDLNYDEDSRAEVDMNIVMNDKFEFVEIQGTAEKSSFSYDDFSEMITIAKKGINELFNLQKKAISDK